MRSIASRIPLDTSIADDFDLVPTRGAPVPGTWLVPPGGDPARRIVFSHGLSFIAGDLSIFGGFVSRLARAANACALFVEYRLAPEHSFPAAHDDCLAAYQWAQENGPYRPGKGACTLVGDSCGASLALSSALDAGEAPAAVILFAPFIDLAVTGESSARNEGRDPLITANLARACAPTYAPNVDRHDHRLSPIYRDLAPLRRLQLHGSTSDPLFDDTLRLSDRACRSGVHTESHAWSDVPHCWYLFHEELREARLAIELAAEFVQ